MKGSTRRQALTVAVVVSLFLLITSVLVPSEAIAGSDGQYKRVMFRDDDVTADSPSNTNILKAVNQVHVDEGVPVTLGVIPYPSLANGSQSNSSNPFATEEGAIPFGVIPYPSLANGSQSNSSNPFAAEGGALPFEVIPYPSLANASHDLGESAGIDYLRSLASSNLFELAQHGYDHHDNYKLYGADAASEFRGMPYDEQYAEIAEGRDLMQRAFGTAPTTFVPPYNTGDNATLKAAAALGFTVYSSSPYDVTPTMQESQVRSEPQSVTLPVVTANESAGQLQLLINQTEPLLNNPHVQDIVVAYHWWWFATSSNSAIVNSTKLGVLRDYIQYLKNNDVTFATLNGTGPGMQIFGSSSNATSQVLAPQQAARTQWLWAMLCLAAPVGVAIFLRDLRTRVK
jgi:hypothetical protein